LTSLVPINFITFPFVPFAVFRPADQRLNNFVMNCQYVLLQLIIFILFFIISCLLTPIAYVKSVVIKTKLVFQSGISTSQMVLYAFNLLMFIVLGLPMMYLTFLMDCVYFWINNFRVNLKKIVIEREPSTITMSWIKKIKLIAAKYAFNRIKAIYTIEYVKKFREDLDINSQLQFLIFGQYIGRCKWNLNQEDDNVLKQRTIDRMKTKVMAERREREKKLKYDTSGYDRSFHMLNQFN